jgi:hypothetical protein
MTLPFVTGFKVQTKKTSLTGCRTSHHKPFQGFASVNGGYLTWGIQGFGLVKGGSLNWLIQGFASVNGGLLINLFNILVV